MARLTTAALNKMTSDILGGAIRIHRALGPGLLENVYFACLCHELTSMGLRFESQKVLPVVYRGIKIDCAYRADIIVEGAIILEVKALDVTAPIHFRQLQTYVRLAECRIGLLLNFGAPTMKEGIKRIVNRLPEDEP